MTPVLQKSKLSYQVLSRLLKIGKCQKRNSNTVSLDLEPDEQMMLCLGELVICAGKRLLLVPIAAEWPYHTPGLSEVTAFTIRRRGGMQSTSYKQWYAA